MVIQREDLKKPVTTGTLRKPCPHNVVTVGNGKTTCDMCGRELSNRESK